VSFGAKATVLGIPISFDKNGDIVRRKFGIYRIGPNGQYNPVG
jgi:hypothetical protein